MRTPEELELEIKRRELETLSHDLAAKELVLNDLSAALLAFERRYLAEVGAKYVSLDEIKAQIAEFKARRRLTSEAVARAARQRYRQSSVEYDTLLKKSPDAAIRQEPTEETRRLYKRIASSIHPDRSTDERTRTLRTRLMAELNSAYARRDLLAMQAVLANWQSSPDAVSGEGVANELVRTIRAIAQTKRRIAEIDEGMRKIASSDLHEMMLRVVSAESQGRDVLLEMAASVDSQLKRAQEELQGLQG